MSAKVNSSATIYQGRIFKMVSENITLANGVSTDLDIIRHPGAAAIVPLSDKNTVLMIKQYRHAVGGYIWEIPAGAFDPGETAVACAKRELIEETGYLARDWEKLGEMTPVPGYSDERIHLFLASGLLPAEQKLDKDEALDVHEMKLGDAMEMIYRGEVQDGKTICGLFMAAHRLGQIGGAVDSR